MYKKAMGALILLYTLMLAGLLILMGTAEKKQEVGESQRLRVGIAGYSSSDRHVVEIMTVPRENRESLYSPEEIQILERIVEAEAGGEDAEGKLLVANVVLNRVQDENFPDTIQEVVFQSSHGVTQFSPVANGRYDKVTVSEETKEAVERALEGEDISEGALYFAARKYADEKSMRWFDEKLTFLFQHGGHEFFK